MQLALSNAALPAADHRQWLPRLRDLGIGGLEVAPAATWPDLASAGGAVREYGQAVQRAGLPVIGLRTALGEQRGLGWLADAAAAQRSQAHLACLAAICRDLGGQTLTLTDGRWRHGLSVKQAWPRTVDFFQRLLERIADYGVVVCLAPLAPAHGDFCTTATDCRILADAIDHPGFGLQINAAALAESGEVGRHAVFASHYGRLEMFVADEPGQALLASSGRVDHAAMRRHLAAGGYRGWVCLNQQADAEQLERALHNFRTLYLRQDNLSMMLHRQRQQGRERTAAAAGAALFQAEGR